MRGVAEEEITDLVVTSPTARLHAHHQSLRALQSSSISVTYTVTTTSVYSAAQLIAQLKEALSTGAFTALLQAKAFENGASDLENASSDSAEVQSESDSDDEVLSTGAIIGIAIGGAAFLIIVFALIYYMCAAKSTSTVTPVH